MKLALYGLPLLREQSNTLAFDRDICISRTFFYLIATCVHYAAAWHFPNCVSSPGWWAAAIWRHAKMSPAFFTHWPVGWSSPLLRDPSASVQCPSVIVALTTRLVGSGAPKLGKHCT